MTIDAAVAAEIRRLHFAERWPVDTICSQLGVHGDVVRRLLGHVPCVGVAKPTREALMGQYTGFVEETLKRYPGLRSTRLYDMLLTRGYLGSPRTVRRYVQQVRPSKRGETFLRPQPLIGEQAQVDWMHAGRIAVPGGERDVWAFVMVLSYSRALWAELLFDLTAFAVRRSLIQAVAHFGGCTRQWLFDNPKTIVLDRHGDAYRFHPLLLELCGELYVQPRLCAVRRPQSKGRVERAVRFLRERFLAGRRLHDLDAANEELAHFLAEIAPARPHPEFPEQTVQIAFEQERGHLLPLPASMPSVEASLPGRVDKYGLVTFDKNRYSVPSDEGAGPCVVVFDEASVRILINGTAVANHTRCWGRRQVIEVSEHRHLHTRRGPASRACAAHARMRRAASNFDQLMARWVEHGRNAGSMASRTIKLLDLYGDSVFAKAVTLLLDTDLYDPSALAHLCDQIRAQMGKPTSIPFYLPEHVQDADVQQHDLETYDAR